MGVSTGGIGAQGQGRAIGLLRNTEFFLWAPRDEVEGENSHKPSPLSQALPSDDGYVCLNASSSSCLHTPFSPEWGFWPPGPCGQEVQRTRAWPGMMRGSRGATPAPSCGRVEGCSDQAPRVSGAGAVPATGCGRGKSSGNEQSARICVPFCCVQGFTETQFWGHKRSPEGGACMTRKHEPALPETDCLSFLPVNGPLQSGPRPAVCWWRGRVPWGPRSCRPLGLRGPWRDMCLSSALRALVWPRSRPQLSVRCWTRRL